jgi:hypothetical protein
LEIHNLIQDVNEHVFDGLTVQRVFLDMNHNQLDNLSFSIFKGHDFANADFGNNKIKTVSGLTEDNFVICHFCQILMVVTWIITLPKY